MNDNEPWIVLGCCAPASDSDSKTTPSARTEGMKPHDYITVSGQGNRLALRGLKIRTEYQSNTVNTPIIGTQNKSNISM